ncbi:carboxypeptidase regulatory-like domain-containing protein [uncultured Paludibaculum sp.]|uniref:TonB-dependent receptor n=1 Tax=uncultured Paludibaculum sp. TaxID=1765020 RepID=UPI002AAB0099|nr:carboxypeptidase regulatory-like domain-containing protein [uncultured Paludibaculum sp.]
MRFQVKKQWLCLASLFLTAWGCLFGQSNTGQITGQVFDGQRALVSGATVEIANSATSYTVKVTTNESGLFVAPSLQPGKYKVTVSAAGFQQAVLPEVEVLTARVSSVDVALNLGSVKEAVTVEAKAPLLSTDTAMVASTVESKLVQDMPQAERSTLGVILLVPGVTSEPGGVGSETASAYTGYVQPNAGTAIGGGQPGTASVLVDGSDIAATTLPRPAMTFSRDTIQEVTVVSNGVPAQYGRTGGGVINQTTRSGSNELHGNAGWGHNDPFFNARQFASPQRGMKHQNFFNGVISGPVILPKIYNGRDKTFFLFNYEPARQSDLAWSLYRLPSPYELQGDFRYSWNLLDQNLVRTQGMDAAKAKGTINNLYYQSPVNTDGFPIGDPYTTSAEYVRIPSNNLAAQLAKNPVAKKLLSAFPTPDNPGAYTMFLRPDGLYNVSGQNAYSARGVKNIDDRYNMKFDHQLSANDRLSVRYSYSPNQGIRFNYWGPDSPYNGIPQDNIVSRNVAVSETHLFGSNLVSETRLTYSRMNLYRGPAPSGISKDWAPDYGLPASTAGVGIPRFNFGISDVGVGTSDGRSVDANYGFGEDFSMLRGRHSLRFGVDIRSFQQNKYPEANLYGGQVNFDASNTGNGVATGEGIATLILGNVTGFQVKTVRIPYYYRWRYYAGYFQDDFKVTPRLTLNLGLRYQVETPRSEKYDRQGSFLPGLAGQVNGIPVTGGFAWSGTNGLGRTLWPTNYAGFEPRVGLAWNPFSRFSVRASYALLHAPLTNLGIPTASVLPELGATNSTIGGTNGGTNPGLVNLITNPIGAIPASAVLTRDPVFAGSSISLLNVDQSSAVPYTQQWSFSMQYEIARNAVLETGYNGTRGLHLFLPSHNINAPSRDTVLPYIQQHANLNQTVNNPLGITDSSGRVLTTSTFGTLRPFQQFYNQGIPQYFDRSGFSMYHAWYAAIRQRFGKGLTFLASYTVAKSIDNATSAAVSSTWWGGAPAQDYSDLRPEKAISINDIPQRIVVGYTYELPVGAGAGKFYNPRNPVLKGILADWRTSGMFSSQAGQPFRVTLGGTGYYMSTGGGDAIDGGAVSLRPQVMPCSNLINPDWRKDPINGEYVNPACFGVPGSLDNPQLGNAGRVLPWIRSPWMNQFDAAMFKTVKIRERFEIELRGDFMGALNHPVFAFNPNYGRQFVTGSYNRSTPATPFSINSTFGKIGQNGILGNRTIRTNIMFRF